MDLSIIILNWNSFDYLKQCLSSIQNGICPKQFEIIIIDNHSKENLVDLRKLTSKFNYRIIYQKQNRGVSGGRNIGIKTSKGKFIMLLDVDTIVFPTAIQKLMEVMKNHKKCGIVAPKLISPQGEKQFTCRKFPTLFTKLSRRLPKGFGDQLLINSELRRLCPCKIANVDYVIGACQLVRREVIELVGLLDENIFYGPEDIDYCLRVWQSGYHVVYCPDSVVVHYERRVTKSQLFSVLSVKHFLGLCYYFYKHRYLLSTRRVYHTIPHKIR
jgi:GT2 family glycosyltransferase